MYFSLHWEATMQSNSCTYLFPVVLIKLILGLHENIWVDGFLSVCLSTESGLLEYFPLMNPFHIRNSYVTLPSI